MYREEDLMRVVYPAITTSGVQIHAHTPRIMVVTMEVETQNIHCAILALSEFLRQTQTLCIYDEDSNPVQNIYF